MARPQRSRKYAVLFGILSLGALAAMVVSTHWFLKFITVNTALAFGGVASGYGALGSSVFGKRGAKLSWWSWLLFWPYFALNYLSLWLFRRASRENAADEIAPGLWMGCRLWPRDEKQLPEIFAVLDLTAEFAEVTFLQKAPHYLCVPVLDTTAPTIEELSHGVEFLQAHLNQGPVYVHCALGHGRSATFVAAYLLKSSQVQTLEETLSHLRKIRPGVDLHLPQKNLLEEYFQTLHEP
ncbi:MAG TPA: dual specificity protein phosphatase family protein [Abditibacteriaceae bacterium]|jgi:hypothetical protein